MNGTIYIYFRGFEIGIGLDELNATDTMYDDEIFNLAINHLDKLEIPYKAFPGYSPNELMYDVSI